jgi:radical SAM protein with 4Fe4S-binding SPASM domain
VDGASPETYKKNRVGGDFNKVFENMKRVALAHQTKKTRLEWQFIALKNNEHEVEKARQMAKEIGMHFFIKGFRQTDPELAPKNSGYRSQFIKKPCTDIYLQLGIYWNGDVVPCCYDTDDFEVMGNVKEDGLADIWNSAKYRDFRARVGNALIKPEEEPSLCKSCLRWK